MAFDFLADSPSPTGPKVLTGHDNGAHYHNGAPADWQVHYVSAYATAPPWEDWAETWAHYLHIIDALKMASAFGIRVQLRVVRDEMLAAAEIDLDPYRSVGMQGIIEAWLPLTFAMNSLNRAMGNHDLDSFVLSPPAITKLSFVHARRGQPAGSGLSP